MFYWVDSQKSELIPSNSQNFSETIVIKREDLKFSHTFLNNSHREELNSNTPASYNHATPSYDQFSLDKEIANNMLENDNNNEKNNM